eukprot:7933938-Ditylum_brightwellii.AAC.1
MSEIVLVVLKGFQHPQQQIFFLLYIVAFSPLFSFCLPQFVTTMSSPAPTFAEDDDLNAVLADLDTAPATASSESLDVLIHAAYGSF